MKQANEKGGSRRRRVVFKDYQGGQALSRSEYDGLPAWPMDSILVSIMFFTSFCLEEAIQETKTKKLQSDSIFLANMGSVQYWYSAVWAEYTGTCAMDKVRYKDQGINFVFWDTIST